MILNGITFEADKRGISTDPLSNGRDSLALIVTSDYETVKIAINSGKWEISEKQYTLPCAIIDRLDGRIEVRIGKKTQSEIAAERESMISDLAGMLTDEQALTVVTAYPEWDTSKDYSVDDRVRVGDNLYKCLQAHTSQAYWSPDVSVSLWKKIGAPTEEYPEWSQPIGAVDAYNKGDKVTYNGEHWICTADNNVWIPGVYGWEKV